MLLVLQSFTFRRRQTMSSSQPDFEHQQDMKPGESKLHVDRARPVTTRNKPNSRRRRNLSVDDMASGVEQGDRAILGRAITLIESNNPVHQATAAELVSRLMPRTGKAHRVGITGVPGVGKSTFIETLGCNLTEAGHNVAVLAVDPSSSITGGSVLGDKTRMARLSTDPRAFIRPSPAAGTLGGVARKTRETMLLCEAAGYDVVLIETVGVGQSETVVADMTDFFLALMLPGAGDELQGIKRGILEIADMIAVNKADGDNENPAKRAAREYQNALHYMAPKSEHWQVPVVTCAGQANIGVKELWGKIEQHRDVMKQAGELQARRERQLMHWMWDMVRDQLQSALRNNESVKKLLPAVEKDVAAHRMAPTAAAQHILDTFFKHLK